MLHTMDNLLMTTGAPMVASNRSMIYSITLHVQIGFCHQLHKDHKIICAEGLSITLSAVYQRNIDHSRKHYFME